MLLHAKRRLDARLDVDAPLDALLTYERADLEGACADVPAPPPSDAAARAE